MAAPNDMRDLMRHNGSKWLRITSNRAQAIVDAMDIALATGQLDSRRRGVVRSMRETLACIASGKPLQALPACWVYVRTYEGRPSKIGHARNLDARTRRNTDSPQKLKLVAAWQFETVAEAMSRESAARALFRPAGDGGREWVDANAGKIVSMLKRRWGTPLYEAPTRLKRKRRPRSRS